MRNLTTLPKSDVHSCCGHPAPCSALLAEHGAVLRGWPTLAADEVDMTVAGPDVMTSFSLNILRGPLEAEVDLVRAPVTCNGFTKLTKIGFDSTRNLTAADHIIDNCYE